MASAGAVEDNLYVLTHGGDTLAKGRTTGGANRVEGTGLCKGLVGLLHALGDDIAAAAAMLAVRR